VLAGHHRNTRLCGRRQQDQTVSTPAPIDVAELRVFHPISPTAALLAADDHAEGLIGGPLVLLPIWRS
jgi:hypothetical protein